MRLLKIIAAFGIAALFSVPAYASTAEVSNSFSAEITITVTDIKKDEYANILVLKKDTAISDAENDVKNNVIHQGSVKCSGSGKDLYIFTLNLPTDFISGEYDIYVNGEKLNEPLYYISFETVATLVQTICAESGAKMEEDIPLYKKELSIGSELYENASIKSIAKKLEDSIIGSPISFVDKAAGVAEFQRRIKEFSCLNCFENGKRDLLFNSSGDYQYEDVVSLTFDNGGVTVNNLYNTYITDQGKKNVVDSLFGISYSNTTALNQQYAKCVIVECIKNSVYDGYGFLDNVITKDNSDLSGISVKGYLDLSNKTTANRYIMNNASSVNATNLQDTIQNAIKSQNTNSTASGGGGGGSKSTSSNPSGNIFAPVGVTEKNENKFSDIIFSDVGEHWAKTEITYLAEKKIISGFEDETFHPDDKLTREQTCKILSLAFDKKATDTKLDFSDVKEGDWFYPYVCAMSEEGVISGIGKGEFGTGKNITREEFAVAVFRLLGFEKSEKDNKFDDEDKISQWAIDAVATLSNKGIINGFEDNTFRPNQTLSRAEASKIIYFVLTN